MIASMATTRDATMKTLLGTKLTRRAGQPTLKGVSKKWNEISVTYAVMKTSHPDFPLGDRFGFAAAVMRPKKYIRLHNEACTAGQDLVDD